MIPHSWFVEIAATAVILLLSVLTAGLLLEHRRRYRAEMAARQYLATMAHMDRRAAMGELTTSLAHELNQPLAAILRNAEAARLLLRSPVLNRQELIDIVDDIRRDDRRASELIRRMRSMLVRGEMETQPVDLNQVARDTVELVTPEASFKGVQMDLHAAASSGVVTGDRVHLQQVLLNLILNGLDAMTSVATDRRRLLVRTAAAAGYVEVSVTDTGGGIAEGTLARIFEPFFSTKRDGMGLGLSIARTIVDAHDGRIVAANNASGGATIRFAIPALASSREERSHAAQRRAS
jgi:signal transduction histidine kinase